MMMQCLGVDAMFGVHAMFRCLCNDMGLMQCSDVDAMFGVLCNYSFVDAMVRC